MQSAVYLSEPLVIASLETTAVQLDGQEMIAMMVSFAHHLKFDEV